LGVCGFFSIEWLGFTGGTIRMIEKYNKCNLFFFPYQNGSKAVRHRKSMWCPQGYTDMDALAVLQCWRGQTAGADAFSATNCKSHAAMLLLLMQAS